MCSKNQLVEVCLKNQLLITKQIVEIGLNNQILLNRY